MKILNSFTPYLNKSFGNSSKNKKTTLPVFEPVEKLPKDKNYYKYYNNINFGSDNYIKNNYFFEKDIVRYPAITKYLQEKTKNGEYKYTSPEKILVLAYANNYQIMDDDKINKIVDFLTPQNKQLNYNEVINFIDRLNCDTDEFIKYAEKIDKEKISEIAPDFKNLSSKNLGTFYNYHFKNNTTNFNKETLSIPYDFTEFLKDNYVSTGLLTDILAVFPATDRNIGEFPKGWNIDKAKKPELYNAIDNFNKERDCDMFSEKLSKITGKYSKVSLLDGGFYGVTYKICVDEAKDSVIKFFFNETDPQYELAVDGEHIEPQAALFLNKHSDKFVKSYGGRVSGLNNNDGYMINQFLDSYITPEETGSEDLGYIIEPFDVNFKNGHNCIKDKIIDFGNVFVKDCNGNSINTSLDDLF